MLNGLVNWWVCIDLCMTLIFSNIKISSNIMSLRKRIAGIINLFETEKKIEPPFEYTNYSNSLNGGVVLLYLKNFNFET